MTVRKWYPLDNTAKIYDGSISSRYTTFFRISVNLKNPVRVAPLQQAVKRVMKRFPYFNVRLRRGLFWSYLEECQEELVVMRDTRFPCMDRPSRRGYPLLLKIRAHYNRISLEISHILTDGTGALTFLRTLICEYFALQGIVIKDWLDIPKVEDEIDEGETDDSYKIFYKKKIPHPTSNSRAFHFPPDLFEKGRYQILTGKIPVDKILKKAKELEVSLGELLIALYFDSIQQLIYSYPEKIRHKYITPIRIVIPVNLRAMYPSKSMKNFFLSVMPEIDLRLGEYSFEEILEKVHHFMRIEVNEKYINQQISRNVKGEKNPFVRIIPKFIKDWFLPMIKNSKGENQYTTGFSNLGRVVLPDEITDYIESFDFIPPPSPVTKINCTAVSFENNLHVTFGSLVENKEIQKIFFRKVVKLGIPVKVETN